MAVLDLIPRKKKKAPKGFSMPAIKVPRYTPPILASQNPVPPRLVKKLGGIRSKYQFVHVTERLAQCVSAAVMLLTTQMFVDWLVNLSFFERFLILAADLGALGYFSYHQIYPLIFKPLNPEACALMVEKHWPRLRGRVIATVQFGKGRTSADSPELIAAVQHETDAKTASMNFGEIIPTKSLVRRGLAAIVLVAIFVALFILTKPGSIALLERVFLLPAKVPRKTEIICLSGNKIIPAGESVLLEAQAKGIIPSHGRATLIDDSGKVQEITMDPEKGQPDRFSLKVDRVESPMSYTITLNDATSDSYTVDTIPRPNITTIECEQVYPPYTGLPNIKRTVGNLALLAGSKLKIHAIANSTITKASIKLIGPNLSIPMTIGGNKSDDLTGEIDIPAANLTAFSIEITNVAGITSGDETQYRIDLIPDRAPTIELTYPERLSELDTLKAHPTIAFVASDDYGLVKVSLCYRIVSDQDATAPDASGVPAAGPPTTKIVMDLGNGHPLNMKNRYSLDFATIKPPLVEGTTLEYWMEAEDGNNVTGPGISDSEHHTIKIVSEAEKKEDIMNRWVDSLSTITDISETQEKVNKDLGDLIQEKRIKSDFGGPPIA